MKTKIYIGFIVIFTLSVFIQASPVLAQTPDEMITKAEELERGSGSDLRQDSLWAGQDSLNVRRDTLRNDYRQDRYHRQRTDTTSISVGRRQMMVVEGTDTTTISLGGREIRIIEKDGNTTVNVIGRDHSENTGLTSSRTGFKGNWRGLEIGLNNFLNDDFSTSLGPDEDFMELRTAKSWNVNLNILQYDFSIAGDKFGMVSGLGFEFNDYRFTNNVSIAKQDRFIVPVDYDEAGIQLEKTKLSTLYLTVPLLMEFQAGKNSWHRVYFSAGVIGGINLGSHTKVVYRDGSGKQKDKERDDFYLSPFRYGLTFRTGYRSLNLFANYYPTPLFQKNKGPELYPVAVGLSILGF